MWCTRLRASCTTSAFRHRSGGHSLAAALAALALLWAVGLLSPGHVAVGAGMEQPLKGQNIDPITAGEVTDTKSVPVYMSVSLEKLQQINEKGSSFTAVFTVVMTWNKDPRINNTVNLINFLGNDAKATQVQALSNCTKWASFTGGASNPDCVVALASAGKECTRKCFMGNGYACCDNIWIPGFHISNMVEVKQDSLKTDEVWLYGATVGSITQDWGAVYRVVRVQALFSNSYNFHRFPFDRQVLKFQITPIPPANHHIVPSLIGKSVLGAYGYVFQFDTRAFSTVSSSNELPASTFPTEQVTPASGWEFKEDNPVQMTCNTNSPQPPPPPSDPSKLPVPGDPQYYAYTELQTETSGGTQPGMTCSVCLMVNRIQSYYIINTITPVVLNSVLAFTVIFARPEDLQIRLNTLVLLFVALIAVQFVIADQLPRTSYATAFTWLVILAYILIVSLILESLFVFYITILEENHNRKKQAQQRRKSRGRIPLQGEPPQGLEVEDNGGPEASLMYDEGEEKEASGAKMHSGKQFMPFMYTEETVMRLFVDKDDAFRIATIVDNVSVLLLGGAYIVGAVLVFTLQPNPQWICVA